MLINIIMPSIYKIFLNWLWLIQRKIMLI